MYSNDDINKKHYYLFVFTIGMSTVSSEKNSADIKLYLDSSAQTFGCIPFPVLFFET